jgi:hypothetical protein
MSLYVLVYEIGDIMMMKETNAAESIMKNHKSQYSDMPSKKDKPALQVSIKTVPVNPDAVPVEMRDAGDIPQPDDKEEAMEEMSEMPQTKEEVLKEVQGMEIKDLEDLKKVQCMINNLALL